MRHVSALRNPEIRERLQFATEPLEVAVGGCSLRKCGVHASRGCNSLAHQRTAVQFRKLMPGAFGGPLSVGEMCQSFRKGYGHVPDNLLGALLFVSRVLDSCDSG